MGSRLLLGFGSVGRRLVEELSGEDLRVVCSDRSVVERLREDGVVAHHADPADRSLLATLEDVAFVIVAVDDAAKNRTIVARAVEAFPDATILSIVESSADADDRRTIDALADHVIDPASAVVETVVDRITGRVGENARLLRSHLLDVDGTLAVLAHDNPDPDAIASAIALTDVARSLGVDAQACYYGAISHQENRAMVNLLDLDLRNLDPDDDLGDFSAFALVDHARAGVNNQLPPALHVDVVIDHHPPRGPIQADFLDLREEAGATSTIMTEYLSHLGVGFDHATATALLFGIRIDTNHFTREVSSMDFEAAATLLPHVDQTVLERVESPSIDADTVDTIGRAIRNRLVRDSVVVANAGPVRNRDALPQAAEELLNMDGIDTSLVFGFIDDMVYVSARSRQGALDLGETLREAFGQIGSAGGHANMAGAQLRIGTLSGEEVGEDGRHGAVGEGPPYGPAAEVITDRFFEAVRTRPQPPSREFLPVSDRAASVFVTDSPNGPAADRSRTEQ